MDYLILKKAGALRSGREFSARRPVWHAVPTRDVYSCTPALCGARPSIQWAAGSSVEGGAITCPKCLAKRMKAAKAA